MVNDPVIREIDKWESYKKFDASDSKNGVIVPSFKLIPFNIIEYRGNEQIE
jgi:hypothetical protein